MKSPPESDDDLVLRLQYPKSKRDRDEAWAEILERHGDDLISFLFHFFKERLGQDIEDVIQETLVLALRDIGDFDDKKGSLRGWLCKIAYNQALMEIRKRGALKRGGGTTIVSLEAMKNDGSAVPELEAQVEDDSFKDRKQSAASKALLEEIKKLPPLQQAIIRSLMCAPRPDWEDDHDVDVELARRHNKTLGAIRTERSKALSTLRDALIQGGWKEMV